MKRGNFHLHVGACNIFIRFFYYLMLFRPREKETERESGRETIVCVHILYTYMNMVYIYIYTLCACVRVWKELQFEVTQSVMTAIWVDTFSEGSWWQLATPKSMSVRIVKGTMDELEFLTIFFTLVRPSCSSLLQLVRRWPSTGSGSKFLEIEPMATQIGGPVGPIFLGIQI